MHATGLFLSLLSVTSVLARPPRGYPTTTAATVAPTASPFPTVVVFVENRQSGAYKTAAVPINGQKETFGQLYGNSITGNAVGYNGGAPTNVTVQFGPPGHRKQYTLGQASTVISATNDPLSLADWLISASFD